MKKIVSVLLTNVALLSMSGGGNTPVNCSPKNNTKNNTHIGDTKKVKIVYKDGIYKVTTTPDHEGYYCKAKVTIKNNRIVNADWHIYDSQNRIFDETYETVFSDAEYKQQCRDDLKGAKLYAGTLIKTQNINKVDAISGATWSNGLFKAAITLALNKARV